MELSSLFLAGKGSALTSFFSTAFLVVFLPFCLVVYSLMPQRGKNTSCSPPTAPFSG